MMLAWSMDTICQCSLYHEVHMVVPHNKKCNGIGCPKELQLLGGDQNQGVVGCRSACEAFKLDKYCCSGEFANPNTCKPSYYSTIFKKACPRAYSYAFDDGTSTFTCKAYEYDIVFCPNSNGYTLCIISLFRLVSFLFQLLSRKKKRTITNILHYNTG